MKKYKIVYSEIDHFAPTIIKANDKEEADNIFRAKVADGKITCEATEVYKLSIDEVGE